MYKRKDGDRRFFQYIEVLGGQFRRFDADETQPWMENIYREFAEYEEVDLTYEEALLIDIL